MDRKIIITDIDGVEHVLPSKPGSPIYEAVLTVRKLNEDGSVGNTLRHPEVRIGYVTLDQATRDLGLKANVLGTLIRDDPWSTADRWARIKSILGDVGAKFTTPQWQPQIHPVRVVLHLVGGIFLIKAASVVSRDNAWEPAFWLLAGLVLWILADAHRADAAE